MPFSTDSKSASANSVLIGDIAVFEAANNVCDCIGFSDVGEELVAKAFAFRGPRDEACNIGELNSCWDYFLWFDDLGELIQPRIGNRYDARVWFDCAEREVFSGDSSLGERVKKR